MRTAGLSTLTQKKIIGSNVKKPVQLLLNMLYSIPGLLLIMLKFMLVEIHKDSQLDIQSLSWNVLYYVLMKMLIGILILFSF